MRCYLANGQGIDQLVVSEKATPTTLSTPMWWFLLKHVH